MIRSGRLLRILPRTVINEMFARYADGERADTVGIEVKLAIVSLLTVQVIVPS